MKKILFAMALALSLSQLPLSGAEGGIMKDNVDSVLASVNGESVTLLDVMLECSGEEMRLAAVYTGQRLYDETLKLRMRVTEEIAGRKLIYQEYKKKPFEIKQQFVEDTLDMLAATMGDGTRESLEKRAKAQGTSIDELKKKAFEKVAVDILLIGNCDRRVSITPKQVYDAYRANIAKWSTPPGIRLQLLQLPKNTDGVSAGLKIAELKKMLDGATAEDFGRITAANSNGPNASAGGDVGWVDVDKMRPEFAEALKNAKTGDVAGPIETSDCWYILRVNEFRPAEVVPFEKVSKEIEQFLRTEAVVKRRKEYMASLKKEAVIKYFYKNNKDGTHE